MKLNLTLISLAMCFGCGIGHAQQLRPGYVEWGERGQDFCNKIGSWQKDTKWTEDENFFISRVKPHVRFRNLATQVNTALTEDVDKKLVFWVPIGSHEFNALPDGVFDSEVFPMWNYVTHYGNWSASIGCIPGNFLDVAHKNGVPVSPVASVPWGNISSAWKKALLNLANSQENVGDFLEKYGIDGLGYNSEFNTVIEVPGYLRLLHDYLMERFKKSGRNPIFENIWYDGTDDYGSISFDRGLGTHNEANWGWGDNERTALFFNYNWNKTSLLQKSVDHANSLGRSPLDLYCGINMQGREPKGTGQKWELLKDYPLSIGLWGAHSKNMFFEYRGEKGSRPIDRQRTYMEKIERWFTGGTRNPLNCPPISNSLKSPADNFDFFGMSSLMSARSALCWDLDEEPFVTHFNLGNGRFLNWKGHRMADREWYNIGVQDHLPTWRWWISDKFMGRAASDVPAGIDAEFTWGDAWTGGSCLRIFGSADKAWLHLFKTSFKLRTGDRIKVRWKSVNSNGVGTLNLALSVEGNESEEISRSLGSFEEMPLQWRETTFTVGSDLPIDGKTLAMIALSLENVQDANIYIGGLEILRGEYTCPRRPVIERAEVLAFNRHGADAKVIYNMPNNVADGETCYNLDVNTSMFRIYARQENGDTHFMGMTTSWGALAFAIPVKDYLPGRISIGVSAVGLDMVSESDIAWSEWMDCEDLYESNDDIEIDRAVLNPGESFTIRYLDPLHSAADWEISNATGETLLSTRSATFISAPAGLEEPGNYSLRITDGENVRFFDSFIQVTSDDKGGLPRLLSLTANGVETDEIYVDPGETVHFTYTGSNEEVDVSRGLQISDGGVGFPFSETGIPAKRSFSVSFWFCPDDFSSLSTHFFNIRDKGDAWAKNNWGWFYHTLNEDGTFNQFTLSGTSASFNFEFENEIRLTPKVWQHFTYVFDFNAAGQVKPSFYLNGVKQKIARYTSNGNTYNQEPGYLSGVYGWRPDNVVAVGGYVHNGGTVRGRLDDMMLWNKALDADCIADAMKVGDAPESKDGLVACWDFENTPDSEGRFASRCAKAILCGEHGYIDTETEGQGTIVWQQPEFAAGSPYTDGNSYRLTATPVISAPSAIINALAIHDNSGDFSVTFPDNALYHVQAYLKNSLGCSEKKVVTIHSGNSSANTPDAGEGIRIVGSPARERIDVQTESEGTYSVVVTALDGRTLFRRDFRTSGPARVTLSPSLPGGMVLVTLYADGNKCDSTKSLLK